MFDVMIKWSLYITELGVTTIKSGLIGNQLPYGYYLLRS